MKKDDPLLLENQLCFSFYACSKEIIKLYQPILAPYNLTYTQYICMLVLWEVKEIIVKDLGEKLMLDSGTLTPLLKKLEKNDYISRTRSKLDERVVNITLTKTGEHLKELLKETPINVGCQLTMDKENLLELKHLIDVLLLNFRDK